MRVIMVGNRLLLNSIQSSWELLYWSEQAFQISRLVRNLDGVSSCSWPAETERGECSKTVAEPR